MDCVDLQPVTAREIDPHACRDLWRSVLRAAWDLAVSPNPSDGPVEVAQGRAWFGSRDFFTVCALAGFDGAAVLHRYRARRGGCSK